MIKLSGIFAGAVFAAGCVAHAQTTEIKNQIPGSFTVPTQPTLAVTRPEFDYVKRVEMVPMRDGTKLYTVIVIPKGAKNVPIILTRTPYNAAARAAARRVPNANGNAAAAPPAAGGGRRGGGNAEPQESAHMIDELGLPDEVFVNAGWIRVYQDVRGKYGSEGAYLMTPPPVGPYNATGADDITDGYDTIDWLVKNVKESNGRVGMLGSSYEGYTVQMALMNPHPALKVALPESPMTDGWMGDDWFHYGAFRQNNLDYFLSQTTARGRGTSVPYPANDQYTAYLQTGSTGDMARLLGEEQLPYWKTVESHPAYDGFWQAQALDKLPGSKPLTVPTMWLQGLWDQEDMWGAIHSYRAAEPKDSGNTMNYLVMGPWFHSQVNREGRNLGPLVWDGDTTQYFRREVMMPFFTQYLVEGAPKADTPPVLIYNTGENHWDRFQKWPLSCEQNCEAKSKPMYLAADGKLSWVAPAANGEKFSAYTSDPAHPVPYVPRPVDGERWRTWLVTDQRFVDGRPDVMTLTTEPLTEATRVSGTPVVNLMASTSGTDSDWVVKIIDVYPENAPDAWKGYELPISLDIFRGRYRKSFEKPEAFKPGEPELVKFDLPQVNHIFQPGHRIMVQVQSTLFPLYDRNPQTFVPNIFNAKPGDYKKAEQKIWHTSGKASFIEMPVVK